MAEKYGNPEKEQLKNYGTVETASVVFDFCATLIFNTSIKIKSPLDSCASL
jgi:hypothetical protein